MASEEHADVSVDLPPDLVDWLDEQAESTDRSREELVQEFLAAYRTMSENGVGDEVLTEADLSTYAAEDDLKGFVTTDDLEDLVSSDDLEEQRSEFTELLDDVRKRVVQVKRETDAKAPAEHDHEALEAALDGLESEVAALSESVDEVEADLDAGFENFEDVLEYLTETTDELSSKTTTLAQVLVDLRTEVKRLSAREARRAEAEALQLAANRQGVESAKCDVCETEVDVSLLTVPECPHCASTFNDVEQRSGLFSSNRLVTGDPPALPEADDGLDDDLATELAETVEDDGE